jgi:hypothetical protein
MMKRESPGSTRETIAAFLAFAAMLCSSANRHQRPDNDSEGARVVTKIGSGTSGRIAAFCFVQVPRRVRNAAFVAVP